MHDENDLRRLFAAIQSENEVREIRAIKTAKGTVSGYYNKIESFISDAAKLSGQAPAVYFTLNPVSPSLLARANNRLTIFAQNTTSDGDIVRRKLLLIDLDPVRPAGISSTEAEHQAALDKAYQMRKHLCGLGWTEPIVGDSGNGAHLLVAIDLPNDQESTTLIRNILKALNFMFSDEQVTVDTSTFNAARISKAYGTLAAKGENTADRPHRLARILEMPEKLEPTSVDKLYEMADLAQKVEDATSVSSQTGSFNLADWMERHDVPIAREASFQGGRIYILPECPFNSEHERNQSAYIVQLSNGAIGAGCHHNRCQDKGWHDLRQIYEPGYTAIQKTNEPTAETTRDLIGEVRPRTKPGTLHPDALYGLAGDVVRRIAPHTEASQPGLLFNFLTTFGNVAGRNCCIVAAAVRHYPNLFVNLVGPTSAGRKGTTFACIDNLFRGIEADYLNSRVIKGIASGEAMVHVIRDPLMRQKAIKDPTTREITGYEEELVDAGVEDKRALFHAPEFSQVFAVSERAGNTLVDIMRDAWDSPWSLATNSKSSPAKASSPHISIIGNITPDELNLRMRDVALSNGFANRFCWVYCERERLLPFAGAIPPQVVEELAHETALSLYFASEFRILERDEAANRLWAEVYPELTSDQGGLFGAVICRREAQVMRIALIYALLDRSHLIREVHLRAALAAWSYCEESAFYIFGVRSANGMAENILLALENGPMSQTEIQQIFHRNKPAAEINHALRNLLEAGFVRKHKVNPTNGGRKPITMWSLAM